MKTRYNNGNSLNGNEQFELDNQGKRLKKLKKQRKERFRVKNTKPHQWVDDEPLDWDIEKDWE